MESKRYATVNELLQDAFTQHKHLPAFTCFGHTFSYAEIDAPHGHDAFLLPIPAYLDVLQAYLEQVAEEVGA